MLFICAAETHLAVYEHARRVFAFLALASLGIASNRFVRMFVAWTGYVQESTVLCLYVHRDALSEPQ